MSQRLTLRNALRVTRAAIMQAETANMKPGQQQVVHDWIGSALRSSANPLPVDMAQLRKLAKGYAASPECRDDLKYGGVTRSDAATAIEAFLKFCKDNAK